MLLKVLYLCKTKGFELQKTPSYCKNFSKSDIITNLIMKKIIAGIMLASCAIGLKAQDTSYSFPENIQDGNILHLFCWNCKQAVEEMENIAKAGFSAIQMSPIQGNGNAGTGWYDVYRPYDYVRRSNGIAPISDDFNALIAEAHKYGIKVIIDVVANHVDGSKHDKWWNESDRLRSTTTKVSYSTRAGITQYRLGDYPDVNTENLDVIERAKTFVQELKNYGVDGIRWDAAKHIALPSERGDFWKEVTSIEGMYHYGEILDGPGGQASKQNDLMKEYASYMSFTDTGYSNAVLNSIKNGNAPTSNGNWINMGISKSKVLYWGESHDTYSNANGATQKIAQDVIDRAWAIGACRDGATSLYFCRPYANSYSTIKIGQKGTLHFMDPEIAEVNHFRNAMNGKAESYVGSNGIACITRQNGGAVIVAAKGGSQTVSVTNAGGFCPEGEYVDRVSGNTFTVTSTTITGTTGPSGIAVIYNDSQSGIGSVEIDAVDGPVEYFTLQGIQISEPTTPGFYIVRQGALTSKVYIR